MILKSVGLNRYAAELENSDKFSLETALEEAYINSSSFHSTNIPLT